MSYNIDHSEYIGNGTLRISREDRDKLIEELGDEGLPEGNFLTYPECLIRCEDSSEDEFEIIMPWWYGSWSGNSFETLETKILTKTRGTADLIFIWEGGDSITGLRVTDGKVEDMTVKYVLEPKEFKIPQELNLKYGLSDDDWAPVDSDDF